MAVCNECGFDNLQGVAVCESCAHDLTHMDSIHQKKGIQKNIMQDKISGLQLKTPLFVNVDSNIQKAIELLKENKAGSMILLKDGKISGIFTERDYLYRVLFQDIDLENTLISKVMTPSPVCVNQEHSLAFSLHEMSVGHYRHIPIIDDNGQCVGILSAEQILNYIMDQLHRNF